MQLINEKLSVFSQRSTRRLMVVLAALSGLVLALLVGAARPAGETSSGLIAFARADGIYTMHPDGGGVHALRRGGVAAGARGLAWSPDGSKLAFAKGNLWVMNADGSHVRRLTSLGHTSASTPTWSADGRRIAFARYGEGGSDIWVVNTDGSHLRRLVDTPGLFEHEVDWSPAGNELVFSAGGYFTDVYALNLDGNTLRNLTQGRLHGSWESPDWSPDGHRIVLRGKGAKIWVMDVRGPSLVRLTSGEVGDHYPVWSPDGGRIVFVREALARSGSSELYVMNADGTGVTRLTHNRVRDFSPAWQPIVPA